MIDGTISMEVAEESMKLDEEAMKLDEEAMKLVELLIITTVLFGEGQTALRPAWTPAPVAF